jgi:hypothetical protein
LVAQITQKDELINVIIMDDLETSQDFCEVFSSDAVGVGGLPMPPSANNWNTLMIKILIHHLTVDQSDGNF